MVAEAEKYAEEDKATRERIEARNGLENYAFSLKNQVNDEEGLGGKIDEEDKETVSLTPIDILEVPVTNKLFRFSTPSRRLLSGSRRMALMPPPRTLRSRRRSCPTSPIPSPPRCTRVLVALVARIRLRISTMSFKCIDVGL